MIEAFLNPRGLRIRPHDLQKNGGKKTTAWRITCNFAFLIVLGSNPWCDYKHKVVSIDACLIGAHASFGRNDP